MATCYNRYTGRYYYCRSRWNSWGRWVVLGVIIVVVLLVFFLISCITARRRRKAGRKPFYGTGWAAAGPLGGNKPSGANTYQPQYQQQQAPYGQYNQGTNQGQNYGYNNNTNNNANTGAAGGYYGSNTGYYGGQQTGVEMNTPQNAYRGDGNTGFAPPSGPPPNR